MNHQARYDDCKRAYEQNVAQFKEPKPKFNFRDAVRIDLENASDYEYVVIDVHKYHTGEYAYDLVTFCDFTNYSFQDYVTRVFESQLIAISPV